MVTFDHREAGTDETLWQYELSTRVLPRPLHDLDALIVVAAHPDDDTLGVGGLIHQAGRSGAPVTVVMATLGEKSHADSTDMTPAELGERRRDEARASLDLLCPHATLSYLEMPDGELRENAGALTEALRETISAAARAHPRLLVVSPWSGDGHRDHRVSGEVTRAVCAELGVEYRAYPIWLWHWGQSADVPWQSVELVELDQGARDLKRQAIAAHRTQTVPLSEATGDAAMLHSAMLQHFDRDVEVLIRDAEPAGQQAPAEAHRVEDESAAGSESLPQSFFDEFYERHDDPWGFDSRWYEERKRRLLVAALPLERYERGVELGCSTGAVTALLAERCNQLVAVDVTESALRAAASRLADIENVELLRATLPGQWPAGEFSLVVLSEIGYYWSAADLEKAIDRMLDSLAPGGHLVACHWRYRVEEYPATGDDVHAALRARSELQTVVRHEERDFVLEIFARPPASSVAQLTGLAP